jgi:hypothetical protein
VTVQTCPNCNSPVRPGAKFCGNCGQLMPNPAPFSRPEEAGLSESPQTAASQAGLGGDIQNGIPCQNCGQINHPGSKHCAYCGAPLEFERKVINEPAPPPDLTPQPVTPIQPIPEQVAPPFQPVSPKNNRNTCLIVGIVAAVVLVCLFCLAIAFFFSFFPTNRNINQLPELIHPGIILVIKAMIAIG